MTTRTRTTRKGLIARLLTAVLAALGLAAVSLTFAVVPASAGNDNEGVCQPVAASEFYSGKIDTVGDVASVTITAPKGMLITSYCVKAGSIHQGLGPEYVTVTTPVNSLTISHSSTKDVSHYAFSWAPAPSYPYAPQAKAQETVCTLVDDVWQMYTFGPVTATGETLVQETPWTDEQKAAADAAMQPKADALLRNEESDFDIDRTGAACRTVETYSYLPTYTASTTACTLYNGTWTSGYLFSVTVEGQKVLTKDTPWTTEEKAAADATLQPQATADLATLMGTATIDTSGASCTPPPPPPPPPTEPEPVTVVEPATVAPVLPATVEEPTQVAIPAAATVPARVPAGDGSGLPATPVWLLALLALGTAAVIMTGARLATARTR